MIDPIPITDPNDARIEPYRSVRERDLVGRQGLFVIEGAVVLRIALREERFRVDSILLAQNRLGPLADVLSQRRPDVPVYVAEADVLEAISGFPLHRGVLAIGRRGTEPTATDLLAALPDEATVLVLSGIANHDNVGGLFRNAAAFGVDAVLLDDDCCDPLYRKAIRVSTGAALSLPFVRGGSLDAIGRRLREAGFDLLATSPAGSVDIRDVTPGRRTAIVMGSEGHGLPPAFLSAATTISIGMKAGFDSLNVAASAGIVLHQLWAARRPRLNTSSTLPTVKM